MLATVLATVAGAETPAANPAIVPTSKAGYVIWADALDPLLTGLMR